ncbi:MAG: aspartate--tRNA ligase [Actinobacteria bacterium]|nr:aspartate--tRNA ligase [Actinomycetota bacterium]
MDWKTRQYCESITIKNSGDAVHLCGWVDTIRDHGQLLFIHIRDRSGVLQLVFDPTVNQDVYDAASRLRSEDVISIVGTVLERSDEAKNPNIVSGDIEIQVNQVDCLNKSETPPFVVSEKADQDGAFNVDEDLRLKYRYLDLRRPQMNINLIQRAKLLQIVRRYLDKQGFIDVETPMLTKSTPEGARDYLVPSRVHEHQFYALPQSPQLFKQLLMMSGLDRYYQVVKCFRDEDLRPNRQPEFTQLDIEAAFIDESYIYSLIEPLIVELYAHVGVTVPTPFPHIPYETAMNEYGSDRPDLRFEMKMVDVSSVLTNVQYRIFNQILASGGKIKGINVKGQAEKLSKSFLQDELAKKVVPQFGGKGVSWMKVIDGKLESNIVQFFSDEEQAALISALNGENGDVFLLIADTNPDLVNEILGKLRLFMAQRQGLIDETAVAPCWVTEFPMYELKDGRLSSVHHPFTQPEEGELPGPDDREQLIKLLSRSYDLVINGEELGGGSIRNHDPKRQEMIFRHLDLSESEIEAKFGFFVNALQYGAPPHGGIALGVDRLVSMILGRESIREVIAFPKNRTAFCPLTQAPGPVSEAQLEDLHLRLKPIPVPST